MNDQPPRSLPAPVLDATSRVLNAALGADPKIRKDLAELAGRRIAILIEDWNLTVEADIGEGRLELAPPGSDAPDAEVSGSLQQLVAAGRSGSPKGLSVTGDAELVHGLARSMARMPAAAWEKMAQTIGDVPARGLERMAGFLRSVFTDTRERVSDTLSEYLQYELRAVATRNEVEEFMSAVDRIRDDTERLAKRFDRLERKS
jgi:ubiquinone biosynthesis protein UbiJ